MVRFKVIKGSQVLMWISIAALIGVILFILFSSPSLNSSKDNNHIQNSEAKAISAFASNSSLPASLHVEVIPDVQASADDSIEQAHILIYHTHTHEAYQQDEKNPYHALEAWRTLDTEHSIVRIGTALADQLRSMGHIVTHNTSDHEQDSLSDSYVRSLKTLENYDETFDLCIDLHRDAYAEGARLNLNYENENYAQLMMLVGRGDNYVASDKPDYEGNLDFSQRLTGNLNRIVPGICRNVTVKPGRYNQHIGKRSVLIEVGHNMNTLQEALNSVPVLAQGIDKIIQQKH